MSDLCDLQLHINGDHTFFLAQRILSKYSGKLRKIVKQEKRRGQIMNSPIQIDDFPGGPDGFELISRFCYNNGSISITVSNVSLLYCCAVFLEMTDKVSTANLFHQAEVFLQGIFYWSWNEILSCLKNCEPFFSCAESCGLIEKLLCSLLAKIAQKSDILNFHSVPSSSSCSSPETSSSSGVCNNASSRKALSWWFQDLTVLCPKTIEYFLKALGAYGSDNTNLVLTRFLLHYLKTSLHHSNGCSRRDLYSTEYSALADTAVQGVVFTGQAEFSCRGLFWVLRIVSGFGLSKERRTSLERIIGGMLDQATLDDLLVSGGGGSNGGGVYDVNLVLRLIRLFVHHNDNMSLHKMKKVGKLVDMYLGEIGPDPNLKISKFVAVAESLPDCARDSFDNVYRAIDIYLESHTSLSLEERSRLCRCLNYAKLSLEACKELAKNLRIPPRIMVEALASQHPSIQTLEPTNDDSSVLSSNKGCYDYQLVEYEGGAEEEEIKVNLEKMQWRVVELEKVCREMKGQMERMVKLGPQHNRPLPRLC